ncbi:unnamed protein product [Prorocentrum cordatum]|uniref:Uncharacterized protein n=1 Tax=Prorocentrum cordatum TaxID=2364126 RepID=A0ABN9TKP0_9DINO|nr:unnamed protein product [Polarella glacialis]
MSRWPLLGCALAAACPPVARAVCWADGCAVGSPGSLVPHGGGTIARAAAARLASRRAPENRTQDPVADDGTAGGAAGAGGAVPREGTDEQAACWALFAEGEAQSKAAVGAADGGAPLMVKWATDSAGAGVPAQMLRAEELMQQALLSSECAQGHGAMGASRALRVFQHAKWLAERDHARAAEVRFREASREAAERRRSVLAQHALARLGYFLAQWGRPAEALEAFLEAQRFGELDPERDPVAPFVLGVVGRQAAGGDVRRLRDAEERILGAGRQPTEELEALRERLQAEIRFWRAAELCPRRCLDAEEVVYAMICLGSHLFHAVAR